MLGEGTNRTNPMLQYEIPENLSLETIITILGLNLSTIELPAMSGQNFVSYVLQARINFEK